MKIRAIKKVDRSIKLSPGKSSESCCTDGKNGKDVIASGCCSGNSATNTGKPPCCGPATFLTGGKISKNVPGFINWLDTPSGKAPRITSALTLADHLGACKVRWGIGRMGYIVPPGLYAIGTPGPDAPVVVTANYKMSYDIVRSSLAGRNVWLLVLETNGVNVWCAAGKGTFGTDELVRRINMAGLHNVVNHRQLILPILGAPGVAAHQVAKQTGFSIRYATIRANDLPEYLDNGRSTTPAMREMIFTIYERLVLVPVEIVHASKTVGIIATLLFLAFAIAAGLDSALIALFAYLGAVLTGIAIAPILLPWLPGRSFAIKGAIAGLTWSAGYYLIADGNNWSLPVKLAAFLALPAISAFYTLNFTGCTVYTSRSGVKKEMRLGIPIMGAAVAVSVVLLLLNTVMR